MIKYFISQKISNPDIFQICDELNKLKVRIQDNDLTNTFSEFDTCKELFTRVKQKAISNHDEKLANAQYVFMEYFRLFCLIGDFFNKLTQHCFRDSWNRLQDCFDTIKFVRRFIPIPNRLELDQLYQLLSHYENLYPRYIFASSEYVISKSHCSICGQSMQSLDCPHIKGELYWGEPAIEIITEIKEFQAVCLVSNPEDKRCILDLQDDNRTDNEKYFKLIQYLNLNQPFLQDFFITEKQEYRERNDIIKVGRNNPCPCGSGKKFKKCCENELYYEYTRYIVNPLTIIELIQV